MYILGLSVQYRTVHTVYRIVCMVYRAVCTNENDVCSLELGEQSRAVFIVHLELFVKSRTYAQPRIA